MSTRKIVLWSQIYLQALIPILTVSPVYADTAFQAGTKVSDESQQKYLISNNLESDDSADLKSTAGNLATGAASSTAQKWLNQFGTARVNLNVDNEGNWGQSSIDLLTPLYDNKKAIWFTQLGVRAPDDRVTGNFGTGVRTFYTDNWMFGANIFFDDDFTGDNRRVGLGGEAWTNYLKFSANSYLGTTNWHSSRDFDDYNEKPADGFDIRAEGYLPSYPQLGAKIVYEQYYGDEVALFDKDHRQSNPSAVTTGISYTPVPLVSFAANYRRGQDSMDDTQFQVNIRYQFGQDWRAQLDTENVRNIRTLAGSRYDLVERNNQIILQYKKKEESEVLGTLTIAAVKDNSPADGSTVNTVTVHAMTTDGKPMKNAAVTWSVSGSGRLSATSGITNGNGDATVNITNTTSETVTVTASSGSISSSVVSSFTRSAAALNLKLTKNNSQANGQDANAASISVTDASGKRLSGITVTWQLDNGATITNSDNTTNSNGEAKVQYTSMKSGPVKLSVTADSKTESVNSVFSAQPVNAVAVTMTTNNSAANGTTANVAQALITNSSNQPMAGISVTWSLGTGSASATTPLTVTTDGNGIAKLSLIDSSAESITVTANAGGQNGSTTATFVAVAVTTVSVTMLTDNSPADGVTRNIAQAVVMQGQTPVSGASLQWSKSSANASFATASSTSTNSQGIATIEFTDNTPEQFSVTATANGNQTGSVQTTFASPIFGPISVNIAGNPAIINIALAQDGEDAVIAPYSGMATGDKITINSSIANDRQNKTLAYTSPVHTVSANEVGQSIAITIPPENLFGVEGDNGNIASLNVTANVTKGQTTQTDSVSVLIDTCAPGQPCTQ